MVTQVQMRRGTAAQWTTANTVLAAGEMGFETDTSKFKWGDGVTAWSSLPYILNTAKRSMFLSLAGGWTGGTYPDGGLSILETATNHVNYVGSSYLASASLQTHEFGVVLPGNYDGGMVTAQPVFYTTSAVTTGAIIFGLQGLVLASGFALDTAYGTGQTSTYTVSVSIANKLMIGVSTCGNHLWRKSCWFTVAAIEKLS